MLVCSAVSEVQYKYQRLFFMHKESRDGEKLLGGTCMRTGAGRGQRK